MHTIVGLRFLRALARHGEAVPAYLERTGAPTRRRSVRPSDDKDGARTVGSGAGAAAS